MFSKAWSDVVSAVQESQPARGNQQWRRRGSVSFSPLLEFFTIYMVWVDALDSADCHRQGGVCVHCAAFPDILRSICLRWMNSSLFFFFFFLPSTIDASYFFFLPSLVMFFPKIYIHKPSRGTAGERPHGISVCTSPRESPHMLLGQEIHCVLLSHPQCFLCPFFNFLSFLSIS